MHNCKAIKKNLIEEALGQTPSNQNGSLRDEIKQCPACREEFASLCSVLRVADQAIGSALPPETFWPGYQARLRLSLERDSSLSARPSNTGAWANLGNLVRRLATASVPVPVAVVLIVLIGLSIAFAMQARRQPAAELLSGPAPAKIRTVEVPLIHERTVTRIVYRDRSRRITSDLDRQERTARIKSKLTDKPNLSLANAPISLIGFRPTSDPKLTIIKGSYRDEK
jgi:hypothetical protein